MKRILILGAGGMAGHVMVEHLSKKSEYEVINCARKAVTLDTILLDVSEFSKVEEVLQDRRPNIVVNCIGMLVQASQDQVEKAILINSYFPHFLSRLCRKFGSKLIHISTDCVFSGDRGGYSEDDFRDGNTYYARTKALGEIINGKDLTLRTSIIGPEIKKFGTGLLHWFLMQRGKIRGFTKAYWSGVTTLELAKVVDVCIVHGVTGLVNLAMVPKISKFDLLIKCQKIWHHNRVNILQDDDHETDKSMITHRRDLPIKLPQNYTEMLVELRDFMNIHREWYMHYSI